MTFNNCSLCQHLKVTLDGFISCSAYPDGIPGEVLTICDEEKKKKECANGVKFTEKTMDFIKAQKAQEANLWGKSSKN